MLSYPVLVVIVSLWAFTESKNRLCYDSHPDLNGLLCYKACKSGYGGAGPVCWANCPSGTTDIGIACTKKTYGRGVGKVLRYCRDGEEKSGLICYPKCKTGYNGVGPVCWKPCDPGYTNDGLTCRRNAHIYNRDVKKCPWHDKCGLCGGPWYNVCGKRRKCGGKCRSGYKNDGCTCRKDVNIYGKKSHGRGVGKGMVCAKNEDQNGLLCYPKCKAGHYGVGPLCWARCSGETTDTGTQCQKKSYGRGVGRVINCLRTPSCNSLNGGCSTIQTAMAGMTGLKIIQAAACTDIYNRLKPYLALIQTFSNCFNNRKWSTVSLSYSAAAAIGVTVAGEVGVAIDVQSKKGICFVGGCFGIKLDISLGADINVGYWKSLDSIPGKSKAVSVGVDIPATEIGATVTLITSDPGNDYLGTAFSIGVGVGLSPVDLASVRCDTPASQVTPFTQT